MEVIYRLPEYSPAILLREDLVEGGMTVGGCTRKAGKICLNL